MKRTLLIPLLMLFAALLPAGCQRQRSMAKGLPSALQAAAEQVGQRIAADQPAGRVLFLHAERSTPLADAMRDGLKKGLGGKLTLEEMGPAQMPANLPLLSGADILTQALQQHREIAAVVSAIGVTDDSAARLPADMPPLYILNWQNPGLYKLVLRHPRCRGGMFYERSAAGPSFHDVRSGAP